MFLPDRFVKGTCPKCKAEDQYGDNCEVCASTYSPMDLINPRSAVSGTTPIVKESEHFFFDLPAFEGMLKNGHVLAHFNLKLPTKCKNGLRAVYNNGIFHAIRLISVLKFRA